MLAKELAQILLEHPDYEVRVGVQEYISNSGEYSYYYIPLTEELLEIDDKYNVIELGGEIE